MATAFRRTRRGVGAGLDDVERELLARLFSDVAQMLADEGPAETDPLARLVGIDDAARTPSDPALARLLPDASRDDAEAAREFRRLTERGLRERKREHLLTAAASLQRDGDLLLSDAEAQAWVRSLTDVRLVLGARLELRTDDDAQALEEELARLPPDDPRGYLLAVYDFLTWLQESLAAVLLAALPREGEGRGRA